MLALTRFDLDYMSTFLGIADIGSILASICIADTAPTPEVTIGCVLEAKDGRLLLQTQPTPALTFLRPRMGLGNSESASSDALVHSTYHPLLDPSSQFPVHAATLPRWPVLRMTAWR